MSHSLQCRLGRKKSGRITKEGDMGGTTELAKMSVLRVCVAYRNIISHYNVLVDIQLSRMGNNM